LEYKRERIKVPSHSGEGSLSHRCPRFNPGSVRWVDNEGLEEGVEPALILGVGLFASEIEEDKGDVREI